MDIQEKIFKLLNFQFDGKIDYYQFEGVHVKYDGKNAVIGFNSKAQKARGCFLLAKEICKKKEEFEIIQKPYFDTCGPMLDVSRGGVMSVNAVKKYIDSIAALGLNMLMLYTEDIYEMKEYPMFGYMRGRYTIDELREIDDYAYSMGIEVIPCIQTLGHLGNYLRWGEASGFKNNANVLLIDEPKTYEFIECEIKTMRDSFRSNRIHLGMDEANGMNLGKYLKTHGLCNNLDVFIRHLNKVTEIAHKYDFSPMIWSDMFFSTNDPQDYYIKDCGIPEKAYHLVPEGVELVYWDYYSKEYDYIDRKLSYHKPFNRETIFAGGVWTWDGFVPNFRYTFDTMKPALSCCIDLGIKQVIATKWGNGGCETDFIMAVGGLAVFSEYCYLGNNCTDEDIYDVIQTLTGMDRQYCDAVSNFNLGYDGAVSPGKAMLYGDLLLDTINHDFDFESARDTYKRSFELIKNQNNEFSEYYKVIFEIVSMKAELLANLRKEYKNGNREYLKWVSDEAIGSLRKLYRSFYEIFKQNWKEKYKPNGFEVFCVRFGGIDYRLEYTAKVIDDYLTGKSDVIEEFISEPVDGLNTTWRYAKDYLKTYI